MAATESTTSDTNEWLTVTQVMEKLGVNRPTLTGYILTGKLLATQTKEFPWNFPDVFNNLDYFIFHPWDVEEFQNEHPELRTRSEGNGEKPSEKSSKGPKGFEGLGNKNIDLSMYDLAILTAMQTDCFSLKNEYGLKPKEIAVRLGITRQMVKKHLDAAERKLAQTKLGELRRRQAEKNKQHRY
jgi:hypothetical protein